MRERYMQRLKRENRLIILAVVLALAWMVMIGEGWFFGLTVLDSRTRTEAAQRFDGWFFIGLLALTMWYIRNRRLMRDALKLEEARIRAQDERSALIHQKAGGYFAPIVLIGLFLATMTVSFLNMTAFRTLSWVLTICLILWLGLQIWLRKRV